MTLAVHNTLTREKEPFSTIEPGKVRMYVCGPTVYSDAHVGHAMSSIVFAHFGILKMGIRDKLGLPSKFDMRYSNPIDLHRVAKDFPAATFVMPHFGCGFLREALIVGDQCGNVCVDTSSSNDWVKTQPFPLDLAHVFRAALRVFGPERILFGTDSTFLPRGWRRDIFDAQVQALKALEVPAAQVRLIFGENLARLLRL